MCDSGNATKSAGGYVWSDDWYVWSSQSYPQFGDGKKKWGCVAVQFAPRPRLSPPPPPPHDPVADYHKRELEPA